MLPLKLADTYVIFQSTSTDPNHGIAIAKLKNWINLFDVALKYLWVDNEMFIIFYFQFL